MGDSQFIKEEEYMKLYDLAKKYDNFELFNERYELMKKNGLAEINDARKSKKYMEMCKTIKPREFVFSVKKSINDNPLYTEVEKDVKKYAAASGVKILD
jgi:hypothetical protein